MVTFPGNAVACADDLAGVASPDWRRGEKLGKHTLTHANGKPLLACTVAFFDDSVCFRSFEI